MKNNAYFDEMIRTTRDFGEKRNAHKARKEEIIKTYGWDSDELKAWRIVDERDFQYPISSGACKALHAWKNSEGDEVIFEDFCWEQEFHDFIEALRKAGFKTFVITNKSSGLMENLHGFAAEGCTMEGLFTITKKSRWGDDEDEEFPGIRIIL